METQGKQGKRDIKTLNRERKKYMETVSKTRKNKVNIKTLRKRREKVQGNTKIKKGKGK